MGSVSVIDLTGLQVKKLTIKLGLVVEIAILTVQKIHKHWT